MRLRTVYPKATEGFMLLLPRYNCFVPLKKWFVLMNEFLESICKITNGVFKVIMTCFYYCLVKSQPHVRHTPLLCLSM